MTGATVLQFVALYVSTFGLWLVALVIHELTTEEKRT